MRKTTSELCERRRSRIAVVAGAVMLLPCTISTGMAAADAENGQRIAERWCAACHIVSPGQQQASADAPPFAEIGARPNFNEAQIAFFLLDPHPKMPNMSLTRREADDLAAYIKKVGRERREK